VPRVSQAHLEAVRDRLVDAAVECATEKGIQATTTREVAQRASVATGLLYRYFRDRAELLLAAAERVALDRTPKLVGADGPGTVRDRVVAMARSVAGAGGPGSLLPEMRFLARRDPEVKQALVRYDRMLSGMVTAFLEQAGQEGLVSITDPAATVEVIQALFEGIQARLVSDTVTTTPARLEAAALALLAVGVAPEHTTARRRLRQAFLGTTVPAGTP